MNCTRRKTAFTQSTIASYTYLRARSNWRKADSFEHLTAILLRATKGLYLPDPDGCDDGRDTEKYSFAREFLLTELSKYHGASREQIKQACRDNKFRHLGNKFRCRVLNRIRDAYRAARRMQPEIYNDEWEDHHQQIGKPPSVGPEEFDRFLASCDYLADNDIAIASALYDIRELPKKDRTKVLASRFGVTEQTARRYVRQLQDKLWAALKRGHRDTKDFFDRLAAFITLAPLNPRHLHFWDERNPGTSISNTAFDDPATFGYHQFQDTAHQERDWDFLN